MRKNSVIKQSVINAVLMQAIVILINCKERAEKTGSDTDTPSLVQVPGLSGVRAISAACDYNIALPSDGTFR